MRCAQCSRAWHRWRLSRTRAERSMMTAGSVHVAVRELFLGGSPHGSHFDLEVKVLAGERMVTIEGHHVARELRDRDGTRTVRALSLQMHTDPHVADAL